MPDATLPNNSTVNLQRTRSVIEGGTTAGSNLFHSFREFSVPTGGEAFFNNTGNIQNIFSRVTGGSISNIDGLIRANGTANLFLLNPNGIIFGFNSRLNIGGSFLASTANSLRFSDGREFSATNPQAPPLLTVNVPVGLQFGPNPGRLVNQARLFDIGLQVKPGETLALVGGEVNLNGGILKAPGGRIELGGVAESAIVGLNREGNNLRLSFPEGVQRADISLTNQARVDVTANVSGNIALNANNIKLEQSSINSGEPFVVDRAGNITLNATGDIFLTTANLRALGGAGEIDIRAGAIFSTGSVLTVSDFGGVGGNLSIEADRSVSLADTLLISVAGFGEASGSINIRARSISLSDGSIVNVNATGGVGGGISFDAFDSVSLSESQVLADGGYPESPGTGGVINITTGSLSLTNGARLTASSGGRGNAGRIIINARDTVLFDGASSIGGRPSGAFSIVRETAVGDGGDIDITAASLTVTNRAELSATNRGNGAAGNINVKADSIVLDNQASISSNTRGGQGNINLQTNFLTLSRDSRITTNATGSNIAGGNITIDTDFLLASQNSDISANSDNFIGGNLTINAQGIFGTEPREALTPRSDITATGAISSGTITLNTPDADPRNGLVELPTNLVDITRLIAPDCPIGTRYAANEFFITGRGGLPPNPREALANNAIDVDWVTPNPQEQRSRGAGEPSIPTEIVEATGWARGANGEVILTANLPNATPRGSWYRSILCPAPQPNN